MKICRRIGSGAFTLLEIMVAIGLLSLVVIAIYASWNSILKGSKVALDAAAKAQRARITLRTIQDSLLCACMFNAGGSNYYFYGTTADGGDATISFVAHLPNSFLRHGKFGDLNTRRVSFSVEPGPDNQKQLVMRQRPIFMDYDKDEMQYPLVLATDVSKFTVEFLDPKTGELVTDWEYTNQLPQEIQIYIALGHKDNFSSDGDEMLFALVAPPAHAVRQEWQMPMNGQVPNGTQSGTGGTQAGGNVTPGGGNPAGGGNQLTFPPH